jgi:hypothetical protein
MRHIRPAEKDREMHRPIDHTETLVLPESELANGWLIRRSGERDDAPDGAFDETLVLEDELETRRRRRFAQAR